MPIRCLDLDDTSGKLNLYGCLSACIFFLFLISFYTEEAPFYWRFERRAPCYRVNLGGCWSLFIFIWSHAGCLLVFYLLFHALHMDPVILLGRLKVCSMYITQLTKPFVWRSTTLVYSALSVSTAFSLEVFSCNSIT